MKGTTIKALRLANRMMEWAHKKQLWCATYLHSSGDVTFDCQAHSYRDAHSFKKEFQEVGKLNRSSYAGANLRYKGIVKDINLSVELYAISKLPPSCKIEYEEIEVPYKESVEAHTETISKMVCGNGEKETIPA